MSLAGNSHIDSMDSPVESESAVGGLHSNPQTHPVVDHQGAAIARLLHDSGRRAVLAEKYLGTGADSSSPLERKECCLLTVAEALGSSCLGVSLSLASFLRQRCEASDRDQTTRMLPLPCSLP